ncbi:MAG: BCCT family transporter [Clostridia bacterium]|nr:BCCT family transporter [Clostridia bacterium]
MINLKTRPTHRKIDWFITLVPLALIAAVCLCFVLVPEVSKQVVDWLRALLANVLGSYYILIGLGFFLVSMYVALSKRGNIRLGTLKKPRYSTFTWGSMVFTATMAADILFYSLHEWAFYYNSLPLDFAEMTLAQKQLWASTYPVFHWGAIPWSFFILPSAAYGYMMFVRGRHRQRLSEACRPLIGKRADGALGKGIDLMSVFGMMAGAATTFSLATPLISLALRELFGLPVNKWVTIAILLVIAAVYTLAVVFSFKGIAYVAKLCVVFFIVMIVSFLIGSDVIYLIETAITALGNLVNNFFRMSTWMDPLRLSAGLGAQPGATTAAFPQSWTVFYWAYWIAWCVATPFFIGKISEGRTLRQTILGGYVAGLGGTFTSMFIFGGYGLHQQVMGRLDVAGMIAGGMNQSEAIVAIFNTLPFPQIALLLLVVTMILFYASTFDALTMVMSTYSYRNLKEDEEPGRGIKAFWSLLFVLLPCALLFSEQTLSQLQTVSIIVALPISLVLVVIVYCFFKQSKETLSARKE